MPLRERVEAYLAARRKLPPLLGGRGYRVAGFPDRAQPLVVVAHRGWGSARRAAQVARAIEQDWLETPLLARQGYEEVLSGSPPIVIVQLRRENVCGCLGHRHVVVKEPAFAEPHEALGGAAVGEMDIAFDCVEEWLAQPLMEMALDAVFMAGSRRSEFRAQQLRFRLLSILLHEIHHMVAPRASEEAVRERSLTFYRDALAHYVDVARATLSLTIDRSFSRLGDA